MCHIYFLDLNKNKYKKNNKIYIGIRDWIKDGRK